MKSRIKILHVIGTLEGGGAERQLQILANNSDFDRYRIAILFLYKGDGLVNIKEGIDLLQIPRGYKWNLFSLWFRVHKAVMVYRPDILHLWLPEILTIPAAFAGKLSGAYILSSARGSRRSVKSIKRRIRHIVSYLTHIMADKIIANFNPGREPWFFRVLFSRKKGCIIRNAITVNTANEASISVLPINKNASFTLWYTGRIVPSKGLDVLLESFIELRKQRLDISLVICGIGTPKLLRQLKKKVKTNNMEEYVIFPGYRNDWHSLAKNADLFVLPSMAEGMSNVLFEAMLLGISCITTDIPAMRDLVGHKINVWIVKAGSRASLTAGIREMYQSASLRKQLAEAGQLYAKSFSVDNMMRAYSDIYNNCSKPVLNSMKDSRC
jgi:glycosyltransferase involved in cell wall biosynthesis